jgi:hypothetical protein
MKLIEYKIQKRSFVADSMGDKLIKISTALKALPLLPGQESLSVASSGTHEHRAHSE